MGKEVKEEQNRLKGCVGSVDSGIGQVQELQLVNHAPSPTGDDLVCAHEVMVRRQPKGESRKSRLEPRAEPAPPATTAAPPGHPPLHIQLQKFTVSADKTLSWLKDNVSMATQVCSVAGCEGLEAAHRCQRALEQEILTNRARIEVVKREGRGLVRAQHPGSAKIQEFLGQLEVLWEELRRRHQRNQVFLQASKELGFRVVKVLQALGSLEAWLESVELSMKESSLAGDPETMSVAEKESRLLEREVAARSPELDALRREVERLHCHSHAHTRGLPGRMDQVEKKYRQVQSALTQQSSELQDTRMLTEFLERVELEEIQDLGGSQYSLGQPLHTDISSAPTLLELQDSGAGDPLMEGMGDPVEELREAVEMLNDTARERGRSQSHDQAVRELLSKHAGVALRVEETLSHSKDLSLDILEKETDMAVQCKPDRCGLEGLWDQQDQLEMDYEVLRGEVQQMQDQASQLQDLCPERMRTLWTRVQTTLEAWAELRTSLTQNHARLQEFVQLQDFFRRYLGMISWTEDTRSCIFSDTALHFGKDGQRPLAAELDMQIEQKFEEFDELAATGRNLLDSQHHLTQMVRERMEELRSMLGWILVHWRVQKQQWLHKKNRQEASHDNIYSEATTSSASAELGPDPDVCPTRDRPSVSDDNNKPTSGFNQDVVDAEAELGHLDDGYEVMKSVGAQGGAEASSGETTKPPILVLKEPGSPTLGGTVNLILSFGGPGDQVQVLEAPPRVEEEEQPSEPVRRVSTYLHVKENSVAPVYESITLPRLKSCSAGSASPTFSPSSSSSPSTSAPDSQTNISSHGGSSIFSSLKRISKKRKRKRDTRRHTIQKIMGVEEAESEADPMLRHACDAITYDTHTWPLKERRRRKNNPKSPVQGGGVEAMAYMKNPLLKDIDTECLGEYSITPYAVSEGPPTGAVRSHCRFLSLGSVLSFDLPKDMTLIPSIQDIITIAPPESKRVSGTDPDPHSQRPTALSSFKQTRPTPVVACASAQNTAGPEKDPPDVDQCLNPPSQDKEEDQRSLEEEPDSAQVSRPPIYINQPPASCSAHKHGCPSVHTLIRDLNGHRFHKCVRPQTETGATPPAFSQASHMVVNLKSTVSVSVRQDSVDSGISSASSLIPSLENPQPRGVVGRVVSLEVGGANCTKTKAAPSDLETEAVRLDRQQFEEEEEELEDIWNQTSNYRQSICSDIMYQPSQDDSAPSDPTGDPLPCSPSPHSPAVLYRNLVTASAPNLLVAEFRLPPSVQSLLGYDKEVCLGRRLPPLAAGDRRSWAAFTHRELTKTVVGVNETASDPVKLPDVGDNQRYIYQYREEEEEEEEEVKVGQEVEEHTGGVKESVQSRSLFSVHMGVDTVGQQRPLPLQEEAVSTEGHCLHANLNPEPPSMEGTLERKHKLQLGGKKAASRGWSSFHAVLHRHTLCFYQDRKETLRSSACALPLNLTAAECSPALDYNKKPNCFRLRLRDGSEYLLNASSRFMMKKWMMKIQASTGRSESLTSGVAMETDVPATSKSAFCSGCRSLTKCRCSSQHDVSTIPRLKPSNATEIVVLTRELSHMTQSHMRSLDERSTPTDGDLTPGPGPTDWSSSAQDWISSKRRSHSFTSATFQKIRPPLVPPGPRGLEPGSNYCVTLVVGDKSPERNPDLDSGLRSYMSLPRPRNKSVFKKFFGKKDF
uniref:PH domain-containing protein n=2 Tax=Sphaeramia orbicularis TaxID=375764 RepID=A0A672ZWJ5_9TELE